MLTLIVVGIGLIDSDVVLSARELKEYHGLFVSDKESAVCHEIDAMQPVSVKVERLPKSVIVVLNEEAVGTKKMMTMRDSEELNKPNTSMFSEQTTTTENDLTTIICSRRDDNDHSSGSRVLREAAERPTEFSPKHDLIDGFVDNLLVRM